VVRQMSPDPKTNARTHSGADGGQARRGNGTPNPGHRRPSAVLRRRNALLAALLLGGVTICGVAAVGYLGMHGWRTTASGAAALHAGSVASMALPGEADGVATAMPELAAQPVQAFLPAHRAGGKSSAAAHKRAGLPAGRTASPSPSGSSSPTSPSPSPSAASPSATPTSTSPAVTGGGCTNPVFTTSTLTGTYTELPYFVANDMWNVGSANASQTLSACSSSAWNVSATISGGGNSVKTYPNSHRDFDNPPKISSLKSVTSTFADTNPGTGTYEDAYDIWLNAIANPSAGSDEVMIWTNNHGQTPGGSPMATVTFDGQSYTAWKGNGNYMAFVANSNVTSGNLNLLDFFQWLIAKGWVPADSTLNQVDYGVEIVTTNGAPATFSFSDFRVNAS
jgi:Glycosyl hydrolase family 12